MRGMNKMRILKEDTEIKLDELPVSFITDMISKGWDEVGYLKDATAAITTDYTGTEKVEQLMRDLMDAYLVFIGQLEAYLHKEDYIDEPVAVATPAQAKVEEPAQQVEPLPEAELEIDPIREPAENPELDKEPDVEIFDEDEFFAETKPQAEIKPIDTTNADDTFDFFVDFDEPDLSKPRITDDELYGHEDSELEHNRLKSMLHG